MVGTPLGPERYDYTGAVLWNAHVPALWARFMLHHCRHCRCPSTPVLQGRPVSYAKVAEYQQRGLIHFHAVIRLDGPAGPYTPPAGRCHPDLSHPRPHLRAGG